MPLANGSNSNSNSRDSLNYNSNPGSNSNARDPLPLNHVPHKWIKNNYLTTPSLPLELATGPYWIMACQNSPCTTQVDKKELFDDSKPTSWTRHGAIISHDSFHQNSRTGSMTIQTGSPHHSCRSPATATRNVIYKRYLESIWMMMW